MDTFIIFALAAAQQAVQDAGWTDPGEEQCLRTGVMIGSGIGGLQEIAKGAVLIDKGLVRKLSPFFIPAALINLASGHVSIKYGFKGWHTNSLKLYHATPTYRVEVNLVYKLTDGHPTTSLAQVLESFDFGCLGLGLDCELNQWRDIRRGGELIHDDGDRLLLRPCG